MIKLENWTEITNTNLPVWDIVLDIEERYAKAMEVMFK